MTASDRIHKYIMGNSIKWHFCEFYYFVVGSIVFFIGKKTVKEHRKMERERECNKTAVRKEKDETTKIIIKKVSLNMNEQCLMLCVRCCRRKTIRKRFDKYIQISIVHGEKNNNWKNCCYSLLAALVKYLGKFTGCRIKRRVTFYRMCNGLKIMRIQYNILDWTHTASVKIMVGLTAGCFLFDHFFALSLSQTQPNKWRIQAPNTQLLILCSEGETFQMKPISISQSMKDCTGNNMSILYL